jgi:hypothetical protein
MTLNTTNGVVRDVVKITIAIVVLGCRWTCGVTQLILEVILKVETLNLMNDH